jgi:Rps23 Pro-64 3,4-dihydroxylase Tpa1-like proline 4-hydroxylase
MNQTAPAPDVQEIKVKLLLAGGQSAKLVLAPDHPLLARLLAAIAGEDGGTSNNTSVFQIPIEGGRASLTFAAHRLVGVITDPAVFLRSDAENAPEIGAPIEAPALAGAPATNPAPGGGELIRHSVVQLDGFLTGAQVEWLMELTFKAEQRFMPSRLSSYRADYRHSLMISAPYEVSQLIGGKIRAIMPEVMPRLRIEPFAVGNIDCQITANVDGSYFKAHTDAGYDGPVKRQLTYVYYFNRDPKGFAGGELRIYDDMLRNGKFAAAESFQVVEPRHNSIAFFPAAVMHEVMPVVVPSKQFRDARFTVNGWVERT